MTGTEDVDTRLEQELRKALQREAAPAGLTDRVLAAVREEEARKTARPPAGIIAFMRKPVFRLAFTAALFVFMIGGFVEYRRYEQEQEAGRAAKRQLMQALRITGAKLQYAQHKVDAIETQQFGIDSQGSERLQ